MRKTFFFELLVSGMFVFDAAFVRLLGIPFYALLVIYLGSMTDIIAGTRIYLFIRRRMNNRKRRD